MMLFMSDVENFPGKKKRVRKSLLGLKAEVVELGPHESMDVKELAALFYRTFEEYEDVAMCGWRADGDFFTMSSSMSRSDVLWLAEKMKQWALGYFDE